MRESCKPVMRTEAPWGGTTDKPIAYQSTYASAFTDTFGIPPVQPIRPTPQHQWDLNAKFEGRSTHQDSYQELHSGGPRESCRPIREYAPVQWGFIPSTTARSSYMPHYGVPRREAIRPARRAPDESRFDTRSTAQDAFLPFPTGYRPVKPFYPTTSTQRDTAKFEHTSTSRAAYIAHRVMPYVAAQKPKPSMGADGIMA
jgi:hypothetical protein